MRKKTKVNFSYSENQRRKPVVSTGPSTSSGTAQPPELFQGGKPMGYQNAYAAYQKTNVNTASQGRLVVLLYEGAVKHLKAALNLFDENDKLKAGDIEQFGIHLQKTQAIITELQVSLDMEKAYVFVCVFQ